MNLRTTGFALLGLLCLAGLYLLVDRLVVTDAERIEAVVRACAEAAGSRETARCLPFATPDCAVDGLRREGTLKELLDATFRDFRSLSVAVDRIETEVDGSGGRARSRVGATVTASFAEMGAEGSFLLDLEAGFVRTGEAWLVERVTKAQMKSALEDRFGR